MFIRRTQKDIDDTRRILPFAILIIALLVSIVMCVMFSIPVVQDKRAERSTSTPVPANSADRVSSQQADITPSSPADTKTPMPEIYKPGKVAHMGALDLAVIGWGFVTDQSSGAINHLMVDVIFRNSGEELVYLQLRDEIKLRNSQGHESTIDEEYELIDPRGAPLEADGISNRLMPGEFVRAQFLFRIQGKIGEAFTLSYQLVSSLDPPVWIDLGNTPVALPPPAEMIAAPANLAPMGKISTTSTAALAALSWETAACGWPGEERQCIIVEGVAANTGEKPFRIHLGLISVTGQGFAEGYLQDDPAMEGFKNMGQVVLAPGERTLVRAVFYANQVNEAMFFYLDPYIEGYNYVDLPRPWIALSDQPAKAELPEGFPGQVAVNPLGLNQEATTGITSWKVTGFHFTDHAECGNKNPGMRYLVLDLVVKVVGPEPISIPGNYQIQLKDAQGRNYSTYPGLCLEQDLERIPMLEPGAVAVAQLGFEVPSQSNTFHLAVKEPGRESSWNFVFVSLLASRASASPATISPFRLPSS